MLTPTRSRIPALLSRRLYQASLSRSYATPPGTTTDNPVPPNNPEPKPDPTVASENTRLPVSGQGAWDKILQETPEEAEEQRQMQAPNRSEVWSRNQQPRSKAMVGPRFEQMIMENQPQPYAAIELIHKQPVRWQKHNRVACDGGGGPLGHPKIFINLDKPQICWCTYCGVPFAYEGHRAHLERQESTTYPLKTQGDPAEVPMSQSVTGDPFEHR